MLKLYVIRHGETDSNIRNTCIGQKDIPLNATGKEQAKALGGRLKDVKFDVAYTSPLQRAVDTMSAVIPPEVKVVLSYDLAERDFGDFDDMTSAEIREKYPSEYAEWRNNWITYKIPNGESAEDVQRRVNRAVDRIIENEDGKTVLIATHLGTARHILSRALNLDVRDSRIFTLDNAHAAVIEINGNKRLLRGLNI